MITRSAAFNFAPRVTYIDSQQSTQPSRKPFSIWHVWPSHEIAHPETQLVPPVQPSPPPAWFNCHFLQLQVRSKKRTLTIQRLLRQHTRENSDNAGEDQQVRESSHWEVSLFSSLTFSILEFILARGPGFKRHCQCLKRPDFVEDYRKMISPARGDGRMNGHPGTGGWSRLHSHLTLKQL